MKYLRQLEPVSCNNMDLSNIILANPNANLGQKAFAGLYQAEFTLAHAGVLVGAAVAAPLVAAGGALIGGGYTGLRHGLAASGACGCEAKRAADEAGLWGDVVQGATLGLAGGGVGSALAGLGAAGEAVVGTAGTGLGALGLYSAGSDILRNGLTVCNAIDAVASGALLKASANLGVKAFGQLADEALAGLSGYGVPDEFLPPGRPGAWSEWDPGDHISGAAISNGPRPSSAAEIRPYGEMPSRWPEFERHHLIEARLAERLGIDPDTIPAAYLTRSEHQPYTRRWRNLIGYTGHRNPINTDTFTFEGVVEAARQVYGDRPDFLRASLEFLESIR
jgi:hypothetical protein